MYPLSAVAEPADSVVRGDSGEGSGEHIVCTRDSGRSETTPGHDRLQPRCGSLRFRSWTERKPRLSWLSQPRGPVQYGHDARFCFVSVYDADFGARKISRSFVASSWI